MQDVDDLRLQRLIDAYVGVEQSNTFTMLLTTGAFEPKEDILNIHYNTN